MGRDDYRYDEDRPRRRRGRDDDDERDSYRPRRPRSGAVGALGVLNLVVGPLALMFSGCSGFCIGIIPEIQEYLLGVPGGLGDSTVAIVMAVVLILVWGVAAIVTAIGLFYRGRWARILALLTAGCALPVGLLYLTLTILFCIGSPENARGDRAYHVILSLAKTAFFLGYGIWTYSVLLNHKRLEEFR